jgi:phosphate transport system protein
MRHGFTNQLAGIEQRLLEELAVVVEVLDRAGEVIESPARADAEVMRRAAERLRRVSRAIDAELVIVAARQAPVADDLRVVLAIIQLAHHGMLIANQLDLISEQMLEIDPDVLDRQQTGHQISIMTTLAGEQLGRALDAFATRDLAAAHEIERQDDALDRINRHVFAATADLEAAPDQRELALRFVLMARSLERIGDNAVDIAEQADFLVTAELREFTDASQPRRRPTVP